jgi:polyhydroxybutyrate depolymerase
MREWLGRAARMAVIAGVCLCAARDARAEVMKWTVDGVQREALVLAPTRPDRGAKAPMVFEFHGHGGNMQEAAEAGLQNFWPEAVVVCMQGLPTSIYVDPEGLEAGWQQEPGQYGNRDLKFFDAVLATLREKFAVDERRVYAVGFSNGAIFAYLLWGMRAKELAAFAAVAGEIFPRVRLSEPRALLQIAGENDDVVPFAKQMQAVREARELDGSDGAGQACGQYCTIYRSSRGAPVETYIHPGGHEWPAEAAEVIVKFLRAQARAE